MLLDDARRLAAAAPRAVLDVYEGLPHVFHLAMLTGAVLPAMTTFLRCLADFVHERPL
ncbi:hypothetical protein AB0K18_08420 [Nonomuraea sp. NPDC049421]|uniref:hypothetical protein n=1 Tax=Nonomuraea sp. NPDC049421 TaxID=3155275 RepID=UPI00342A7EB1